MRSDLPQIYATQYTNRHGFTLIELSIVLVVIGLIIGGILVGRDMIRAAELRSVITDVEAFKTAINTFKLKFNCIPGDCANAYSFWGDSCGPFGTGGTNGQLPGDNNACNGNGNGYIDWWGASWNESVKAWQHLSLSGLIPGSYSGYMAGPANIYAIPGVVLPPSKIANGVYVMFKDTGVYGNSGQYLVLSKYNTGETGPTLGFVDNGLLPAFEAYSIDQKMDDGSPSSGQVFIVMGVDNGLSQAGCVTDWFKIVTSTTLLLTDNRATCRLYFSLWP